MSQGKSRFSRSTASRQGIRVLATVGLASVLAIFVAVTQLLPLVASSRRLGAHRSPSDSREILVHHSNRSGSESNKIVFSRDVRCAQPNVSRGELEMVIAGWRYEEDFTKSYVWDLGLTNARIVLYRRVKHKRPARMWYGPCGMEAEEIFLPPNRGLDASAFYDYAVRKHAQPPKVFAFLHGHIAISWHTSCEAVISRLALAYQNLIEKKSLLPQMVTLTSHASGKNMQPFDWFGGRKLLKNIQGTEATLQTCKDILAGCNPAIKTNLSSLQALVDSGAARPKYHSCCASFIMNGYALRHQPVDILSKLRSFSLDSEHDDKVVATHCFEFVVYELFVGDAVKLGSLQDWYSAAEHMLPELRQSSAFRACNQARQNIVRL